MGRLLLYPSRCDTCRQGLCQGPPAVIWYVIDELQACVLSSCSARLCKNGADARQADLIQAAAVDVLVHLRLLMVQALKSLLVPRRQILVVPEQPCRPWVHACLQSGVQGDSFPLMQASDSQSPASAALHASALR